MSDNTFQNTVNSLFKGMDSFISSKTVVGDAIHIGENIILPLVDVTFGVGASASTQDKKNSGIGGMGGKLTPSAVLVINKNGIRLVNVKNQDTVTKILDMAPDLIDRFKNRGKDADLTKEEMEDIKEQVDQSVSSAEKAAQEKAAAAKDKTPEENRDN